MLNIKVLKYTCNTFVYTLDAVLHERQGTNPIGFGQMEADREAIYNVREIFCTQKNVANFHSHPIPRPWGELKTSFEQNLT